MSSLNNLRKWTEAPDRNEPALTPSPVAHWAAGRDSSRYVRVSLYPRTLNELRKYARHFGRAAARDAEWCCVTVWLMHGPPDGALRNPYAVAQTAVIMARAYDRYRFEYPRHDGTEAPAPILDTLSPDVREEGLRVAAETLADWRNAGRPHLGPHRIKAAYQSLVACPGFIARYVRPPIG